MADLDQWSTTAANNNSASPDGWPENMAPSGVNDSARENMRAIRKQWNDAQWFQYGDGDGAATVTWVAATQFKVEGADVSTEYHVGRRVRITAATPGTIYGTITAVAFVTDTTVTVQFDSGSLSNEALTVWLSTIRADNSGIPGNQLATDLFIASAGSVSAPSYIFSGDTDTGAYQPSADQWALALAGVQRLLCTATTSSFIMPTLAVVDSDGGAAESPALFLTRDSGTPAANDNIGVVQFRGRSSTSVARVYVKLLSRILDPTNASEDGLLVLQTMAAGVLAGRLLIAQGIYTPNATGGDPGADRINTKGYERDGTDIPAQIMEESTEFTSASNTLHTHTLTTITTVTNLQVWIRCKTAEHGYAVGDEILIDANQSRDTSGTGGTAFNTIFVSGSTVNYQQGPLGIRIAATPGGGFVDGVTAANWKIFLRAFGY